MSAGLPEQRTFYKGNPLRPWLRVQLVDPLGIQIGMDIIADTGNPYSLVVGEQTWRTVLHRKGPQIATNFGLLRAGWARVVIPDVGFDAVIRVHGSDQVRAGAQLSHPDFEGLMGLPLLRAFEYGGDAGSFWIRQIHGTP